MTVTTDNLPPHPVENIAKTNGEIHEQWNNWLITLRDQVLGKNNVSSDQTLDVNASISVTSSIIRAKSSGGSITLGNPQILPGFDGQIINVEGLDNTDKIILTDGTGLSLENGLSFELKRNSKIDFDYNAAQKIWIERNRRT